MSIGQFALQASVYSALNGDNNLTSTLGAGVYDEVLETASFPYVAIGEDNVLDYGTVNEDGGDFTLTIHVWSQYHGSKEAKEIMDRVHSLLHDSSLSVTGFNLVNLRFEFSDIIKDPDGITRHGIMRFRAVILGTS